MRRVILLLVTIALTGCSMGRDYVRPEVNVPASWRVNYQAAAGLANTNWWQQFGDPVLDELIRSAVRENLDLKVATARVDQFLGALDTTRSQYFPQVSAEFIGGIQQQNNTTTENYQASVNASWELDLWGRVRRSNEAARARIVASEAGRRAVLISVVSNVAGCYLTLRGLDRQLEIARETEKAYAESLRLFRLRFKHGTVSQLEVSQAESQYEAARQTVPDLESRISQQENLLSLLLGRSPCPIPRGRSLDELTAPVIPAGLPSELIERRPDIIQAEQELVAANAEVGAAKTAYFPKISLTGALGIVAGDLGKFLSAGTAIGSAVGQVAAPVLTWGAISGQVKQAESLSEQALIRYRLTILIGLREVEDALVKTMKGREQLEAQKRQVVSLEEYGRLAKMQFEAGRTSYLQVLDSDRSLFSSRITYTQSKYELLINTITIYKALGCGWNDNEETVK